MVQYGGAERSQSDAVLIGAFAGGNGDRGNVGCTVEHKGLGVKEDFKARWTGCVNMEFV